MNEPNSKIRFESIRFESNRIDYDPSRHVSKRKKRSESSRVESVEQMMERGTGVTLVELANRKDLVRKTQAFRKDDNNYGDSDDDDDDDNDNDNGNREETLLTSLHE